MDYMCIAGTYRARVTGVNVLRAAGEVYSDHYLVACRLKLKLVNFVLVNKVV